MSGMSLPDLTDLAEVPNLSSAASSTVPAADAFEGTQDLILSGEPSAYFGECAQGFL